MELKNDRYIGIRVPLQLWEEIKKKSEKAGFCTGSYIRSLMIRDLSPDRDLPPKTK
jgi:predicted DNA binding CopG/RHH family protein